MGRFLRIILGRKLAVILKNSSVNATGGNFRFTFRFDGRLETKKLLLLCRNPLLLLKKTLLKPFHLALLTSKNRGKNWLSTDLNKA